MSIIKHHDFFKVHSPNKHYDLENNEDAVNLLMEEFYLSSFGSMTQGFKSNNPIKDEFEIILYPSIVYVANKICSIDNEIFQYLNTQIDHSFITFLTSFNPLYKCNGFIDYHFSLYMGNKKDFIKHIKFQIIPLIKNKKTDNTNIDYENLELILHDWVNEKLNEKIVDNQNYLLESIKGVCLSFLDNVPLYRDFKDENKYNTIISNLLNQRLSSKNWTAKDQTLGGSSGTNSTANKAGLSFRDIIICDETNCHITAIECLRVYSVPKNQTIRSIITSHLTKIFQNEPLGLSPLFIIIYCETKSFSETWKKYLSYCEEINFTKYHLNSLNDISNHSLTVANLKIAKALHTREESQITIYHIFINMFP